MRVFAGSLATETNTFSPLPTGLDAYREGGLFPAGTHPPEPQFFSGPLIAAREAAARGACTLFATHYHELTQLADTLPRVTNLHVSVREWNDEVVFLHKIVPGRTDRSYGIHVARLAGLPRETVARAKEVLELLGTVEVADALSGRVQQVAAAAPQPVPARKPAPTPQLSLFTEYVEHPALGELRQVDLNALTPLAAFDLLRRLAESARG